MESINTKLPPICVDIGNTRVSIARSGKKEPEIVQSLSTTSILAKGKIVFTRQARRACRLSYGAVLVSVVPDAVPILKRSCEELIEGPILEITSRLQLPFSIKSKNPEGLGADRLCTAAGAVARRKSVIVIDIGSAITVDMVVDHIFMGGVIMVGPDMALKALGSYAARLPNLKASTHRDVFLHTCINTSSSMILGSGLTAVGSIKEAVRLLQHRFDARPVKVITGGAAAGMINKLPSSWVYSPNLIFEGMLRIWESNSY